MRRFLRLFFAALTLALLMLTAALWWWLGDRSDSNGFILRWLTAPETVSTWTTPALTRCPAAPFVIPSQGYIGLLWRDDAAPYTPLRRHTGVDIFGVGASGTVPIYAAYDGYLTRLEDWRSTVIIRHDDPLQAGRTIWTYYTHMASRDGSQMYIAPDFPQGTYNQFVPQGTLIGYQGEYSPGLPIAMHLHFSIVTSASDGSFRNEAILENTLDPSPYFGMELDVEADPPRPPRCESS